MAGVAGKNFKIRIDRSSVMTDIAGQRGGTLNISADPIDTTSKDDNAWGATIPGTKSWSIEFDALVIQNDAAYQDLIDAIENDTLLTVEFQRQDGKVFRGGAYLTDFPHEAPYDDAATYSGTLSGVGQPTKFFESA